MTIVDIKSRVRMAFSSGQDLRIEEFMWILVPNKNHDGSSLHVFIMLHVLLSEIVLVGTIDMTILSTWFNDVLII